MSACPPAEQLLDFAAGRLSDDSQASLEGHIDSCASCRASLSALAKHDAANQSFGRYRLETVLGSGGMGVVYRAWDPQLARAVAIKVVRQANDQGLRTRLVREAQSLAKLSHPNVCHVYDVGTDDAEVWLAMELIEGTTLRQWAATTRSSDELMAVLLGAAEGIAAAHASGLIHRDIKPENVLVTRDGRPIVTDFGLARIDLPVDPSASTISGDPLKTATGAIVGTPAYLAPEQMTGDTLDARVDQFAWAVMAWELLTGARPFPIIAAIRLDAIRVGVTPPPSLAKHVADALVRAMALAPRDRFGSMRELIDALRATPPADKPSRTPFVVGGAAVLAALTTVIAWQVLKHPDEPAPVPAPVTIVEPPVDAQVTTPPPPASDAAVTVVVPDAAVVAETHPVEKKHPVDKQPIAKKSPTPVDPYTKDDAPSLAAAAPPSPPPAPQPQPAHPLKNPSYSLARAYATLIAFCRLPMDPKRPDPALGRFGIIDWGTVVKREIVVAKLVDREMHELLYEVRGQRDTYQFDGSSIAAGVFGILDVPIGTQVALCVDPMRPEKSTIYELPPPWNNGVDLMGSVLPITRPPLVDQMKTLAPLHVDDRDFEISGEKGELKMKPAGHYLVRATVKAADGDRWDMGKWWIEVPKVKGAELVAAGKRLWLVIEKPRFEDGGEGNKPKLIAKVAMVFDEILPH